MVLKFGRQKFLWKSLTQGYWLVIHMKADVTENDNNGKWKGERGQTLKSFTKVGK
jgi:hypothetical protein